MKSAKHFNDVFDIVYKITNQLLKYSPKRDAIFEKIKKERRVSEHCVEADGKFAEIHQKASLTIMMCCDKPERRALKKES